MTLAIERTERTGKASPRAQVLIDRIDAIAAELEAEAPVSEQIGKLTDRALELLAQTGVQSLLLPVELGGMGLYPGEALPVLERVSYIDGAIGWLNTIFASSGQMLAYLAREDAEELLAEKLPLFAASGAPNGKAIPVEGGFRFSGAYSYSSGGLHADYVFCSGFIMDGDKPASGPGGMPMPLMFIVPSSEVTHTGNWDTIGLRGTGSVDFVVDDVFVPTKHAVQLFGEPITGGPEVHGGFMLLVQLMHLGFASGITRRILDELTKVVTKPSSRPGVSSVGENERFRVEFATHDLAARAARSYVSEIWADIDATLARGEQLSRRQLTLVRGSNIHLHNVAREIATWAYRRGGGTSLRQGTLQRAIRDTLAGAQHAIVDDAGLVDIGFELLGAPDDFIWLGLGLGPAPAPRVDV